MAWFTSLGARVPAFLNVVLLAHIFGEGSDFATAYVLLFAVNAAVAYLVNNFSETASLAAGSDQAARLPGALVALAIVGPAVTIAAVGVSWLAVGAAATMGVAQVLIAERRARLLVAGDIGFAYGSVVLRDLPITAALAAVGLGFLTLGPVAATGLVWFGVWCQCLVLTWFVRRRLGNDAIGRPAENTTPWQTAVLILVGAIGLAGLPVMIRSGLARLGSADELVEFEALDRLGYIVSIAVLGGVGTELQRRWARSASVERARLELRTTVLILLSLGMIAAVFAFLVGTAPLKLLFGQSSIDDASPRVMAVVLLGGGLNLAAIACSRFLLAAGRYSAVAGAFGSALVISGVSILFAASHGALAAASVTIAANAIALAVLGLVVYSDSAGTPGRPEHNVVPSVA